MLSKLNCCVTARKLLRSLTAASAHACTACQVAASSPSSAVPQSSNAPSPSPQTAAASEHSSAHTTPPVTAVVSPHPDELDTSPVAAVTGSVAPDSAAAPVAALVGSPDVSLLVPAVLDASASGVRFGEQAIMTRRTAHLIAEADEKPLRVFLEVGESDLDLNGNFGDGMHDWVEANNATAAALAAKTYHYRYLFAKNAGHVDGKVLRQTLPDTLRWLWVGYPIE